MKKRIVNSFITPVIIVSAICISLSYGKQGGIASEGTLTEKSQAIKSIRSQWTSVRAYDGNEWFSYTLNDGSWTSYHVTGRAGGVWPRGTSKSAIFDSGLWIGAVVGGEVRVSAVHYGSAFSPGPILSSGTPGDPNDPTYRVYKVNRWDGPGTADWDEWPSALGAPIDEDGNPYIPVDQTLFAVYNDLVEDSVFWTPPLGAEVRQTIFGGATSAESGLNRTFYVKYEIINKSDDTWENARFSVWSDPDLGDHADDLAGVDVEDGLAFCYNDPEDAVYGIPPAVGYRLLQGPLADTLSAFSAIILGTHEYRDPWSAEEAYSRQLGLTNLGDPITDPTTGNITPYEVSGDPVTGDGWIDSDPADRRLLLTTDGGNVAPGDTSVMVVAVTIERGTDNLDSVTELRAAVAEARDLWTNGFSGVTLVDRPILGGEPFLQTIPVRFIGTWIYTLYVGSTDPEGITEEYMELSNGGNQSLTGTIGFPDDSQFSVSPESFSLAPGESETFTLKFSAPEATPATRHVPDEFSTIQEAVGASQVSLFSDSLDVTSNDPYAGQEENSWATGWMNFAGDTILVGPGIYNENVLVQGRTVHLISTAGRESTIIDGNESGRCVRFFHADGSSIHGFTIQNGYTDFGGGGIHCRPFSSEGHITIVGNLIQNNYGKHGGGIRFGPGTGRISRNLIINNAAELGGGASLRDGFVDFSNNTIWGNAAYNSGSGLYIRSEDHRVVNTIVWGNTGGDALLVDYDPVDYPVVYCDIEEGWPYGEGNINSDPLFVDPVSDNFELAEGSPCIDAGTALFVWNGDTVVNLGTEDYMGDAPDMGAVESPYSVTIHEDNMLPTDFVLHQNYPNPFNPYTTILYDLPSDSRVNLVIYDILGRKVRTLVDEQKLAGYHSTLWDGRDRIGVPVGTGVYIYRISARGVDGGSYSKTHKMLLLK